MQFDTFNVIYCAKLYFFNYIIKVTPKYVPTITKLPNVSGLLA